MSKNTGIIITMAYPETIVMVAKEWYSPFLRYLGIGKKDYLRAGHAALVLIEKSRGDLEYHDFGRYITAEPNGRVRGGRYDRELLFPIKAEIVDGVIQNLDEILSFLSMKPRLTHGDGKLVASVCDQVNYHEAKNHIEKMQRNGCIRYAAFKKKGSNCARFVAATLITSVTNPNIKKDLVKSQWFTPSTVGNVVKSSVSGKVYEVNSGVISEFISTVSKENRRCFLDRLPEHKVNLVGTLESKKVKGVGEKAQWLSGIAAGAWFELTNHHSLAENEIRVRRISSYGNIDVDAVFLLANGFDITKNYELIHNSNCLYCTVKQNEKLYCLSYNRDFLI